MAADIHPAAKRGGIEILTALGKESNKAYTENGARSNRSTGSHCLNFFAACGAMRGADVDLQLRLFVRAYAENKDLALRTLFYARDIREGLGERDLFRNVLSWLAVKRPHSVMKNLPFIAEYGRWDDILSLLGTPCEAAAVQAIRDQLQQDLASLEKDESISLLAKWLPSVNPSSEEKKNRARLLCRRLKTTEKEYRRTLSRLRARLDVLEKRLCEKDYTFDYSKQPSGAMHKYRQAFLRNDKERYKAFLDAVHAGEKTMHAGALYPYQILEGFLRRSSVVSNLTPDMIQSLDASWKSLPDYGGRRNALAVIDGSGSMYMDFDPRPADVALSLGIYFAERNKGYFKDHFITFSRAPRLVKLEGDNIVDRAAYCASFNECANTNLRATFELLLETAVRNHLPQEELPETLYIISDMEFDQGVEDDKTLFEEVKALYDQHGYHLPALVYWNVRSRHEQFPVTKDEHGTVLVSGASLTVFRMVISQDVTPEALMLSVLNRDRYMKISA